MFSEPETEDKIEEVNATYNLSKLFDETECDEGETETQEETELLGNLDTSVGDPDLVSKYPLLESQEERNKTTDNDERQLVTGLQDLGNMPDLNETLAYAIVTPTIMDLEDIDNTDEGDITFAYAIADSWQETGKRKVRPPRYLQDYDVSD